jgi:hypothetical protein
MENGIVIAVKFTVPRLPVPIKRAVNESNAYLAAILLSLMFFLVAAPVTAAPQARDLTSQAMEECDQGRRAHDRATRLQHFEKGETFGEQAVAADEQSAAAHFSLFCNLGEQMRIDGETSIASVLGFRRMMKELDRTLELSPHHLDALSAKGTFLVRLPVLLGGDKKQGEALLRHVIEQEPMSVNARLSLAKSYSAGGRHEEAVTLAAEALDLAQSLQRADFIPEARRVLSELRAHSVKGN